MCSVKWSDTDHFSGPNKALRLGGVCAYVYPDAGTLDLHHRPKRLFAHPFHSDSVNNNKYVIKQWFYWYFMLIMNNSM